VAYGLRSCLTEDQLLQWGWRIPFLSGISISFCGIYLKYFCQEDEILPGHSPVPTSDNDDVQHTTSNSDGEDKLASNSHNEPEQASNAAKGNPLRIAFSKENRRSLLASAMVPMVWSGGFYLSFVWMAIYMQDLVRPPVPSAFAVNSGSLLLLCVLFPFAGIMSDYFGRKWIMTIGGVIFGVLGPWMILRIGKAGGGESWVPAFASQAVLSLALSSWGAPMCAWLVETFDPRARLTSVSIGYNIAQALSGGLSPFLATLLVDEVGTGAPGLLLAVLSVLSLSGLWCVNRPPEVATKDSTLGEDSEMSLELREMS